MNHLNKIIDNKGNDFNVIFIEKFNVKKFCEKHGYHYSNIPRLFDYDVSDIHYHIRVEDLMLSDEPIIIHLDYTDEMKNSLKSLLDDIGIDNRICIIVTNNLGADVPEPVLARIRFNYRAKETGFNIIDKM